MPCSKPAHEHTITEHTHKHTEERAHQDAQLCLYLLQRWLMALYKIHLGPGWRVTISYPTADPSQRNVPSHPIADSHAALPHRNPSPQPTADPPASLPHALSPPPHTADAAQGTVDATADAHASPTPAQGKASATADAADAHPSPNAAQGTGDTAAAAAQQPSTLTPPVNADPVSEQTEVVNAEKQAGDSAGAAQQGDAEKQTEKGDAEKRAGSSAVQQQGDVGMKEVSPLGEAQQEGEQGPGVNAASAMECEACAPHEAPLIDAAQPAAAQPAIDAAAEADTAAHKITAAEQAADTAIKATTAEQAAAVIVAELADRAAELCAQHHSKNQRQVRKPAFQTWIK